VVELVDVAPAAGVEVVAEDAVAAGAEVVAEDAVAAGAEFVWSSSPPCPLPPP
jgi:hypothetical protein